MKLFSILMAGGAGFLLSGGSYFAAEAKPDLVSVEARARELAAQLGADDFTVRGQAMKDVWQMADDALPTLQELIESDDPELQSRAIDLRRQILSGILPDTPPEISAILVKFNQSKGDDRLNVFNELFRAQAYEYLFRLMKIEEDRSVLMQMKTRMERYLPEIVRASLGEGKWDEARSYLENWHSPANDRNLAALLKTRNLLDAELQRLSTAQKPEDRQRYLAFLQVKGDPQAIFDEAEAQGNTEVRDAAAILLGKPEFALRSGLEDKNMNQRRYLRSVLARLEDDAAAEAEARTELLESAEGGGELQTDARRVFYRLGNLKDVQYLSQDDKEAQEVYYFTQEKLLEALTAAGLKDGKLDLAWLEKKATEMAEGVMENDEETASNKLKLLAGFYENHGEIESASLIVEAYVKSFMGEDQEDYLAAYTADFLLFSPRAFCVAMGRLYAGKKAEEGQRIVGLIFSNFREDSELLSFVYEKVIELRPKLGLADKARLALSCATEICYVKIDFRDDMLAELEKKALADLKGGIPDDLRNLMRLAITRNDSDSIVRIGTVLSGAGEIQNWGYALTMNHAYWGRWNFALDEWVAYLEKGKNYASWPPYLYQQGLLLKRNGKEKDAQEFFDSAQLLGLDENDYQLSVLSYLANFGDDEAEEYALRKKHMLSQAGIEGSGTELLFLYQQATKLHDWPIAESVGEVILAQIGPEYTEGQVLQIRYGTDMARGFRLLAEGKKAEAEATLEAAHDLIPGSGLHADELFPQLRAHGLLALHDHLFEKSYARMMEVLALFPKSENDKNTASWLASRAILKLDESEKMMNEVIAAAPVNPAYLDTMAEIQFARGDREKAVEWSKKSLVLEVSDATLRGQYERYKNGPLPSRGSEGPE